MSTPIQHPFAPLMCPESRILILGSFPSVKSREIHFYFGPPQTLFGPLVGVFLAYPAPTTLQ